jgi:hypothetical protein
LSETVDYPEATKTLKLDGVEISMMIKRLSKEGTGNG